MQANVQISLGRVMPQNWKQFSGLFSHLFWSSYLSGICSKVCGPLPPPNNSEPESLLKLERAVMAAKALKFWNFHGSWWLRRRKENTLLTLLRKWGNMNSAVVCSVWPVGCQPAQEDKGVQAEPATVHLWCFRGVVGRGQ